MSEKTNPILTEKFGRALQQAFELHGADVRKGSSIPVMAHLLSVCSLVLYDGGCEDEAIAALLHDALEDKPELINRQDIEQGYGEKVLKIIETSTDTPPDFAGGVKPPWRLRKKAYLKHAGQAGPALLRVTVADKVDNARAMLRDYRQVGIKMWSRLTPGRKTKLVLTANPSGLPAAGSPVPLLVELTKLVTKLCRLPRVERDPKKRKA